MSLKIQIYRNVVNANHLSSEPSPPPPKKKKSDNYTRSLPFASHSHLLSEKQVFLPRRFVSTVAVFEKFHFIVILRSKIFVIASALKLQALPKRKRFLLLT